MSAGGGGSPSNRKHTTTSANLTHTQQLDLSYVLLKNLTKSSPTPITTASRHTHTLNNRSSPHLACVCVDVVIGVGEDLVKFFNKT